MSEDSGLVSKMYKLRKTIPQDMVEDFEAMDEEGLRNRIVESEANIHEIEKAMECDGKLKVMKEQLKDLSAGYRDGKKLQTSITSYCLCLLEGKGKI